MPAGKNGLARRQTAVHLVVVLGHFWRAKYGYFSRAPKGIVFKTILDARELAFLIRQIDEYIQVMEVMIRKTAALDDKELALARNLRK